MISASESILLDIIKSLENINNEFGSRLEPFYTASLERLDLLVELALARIQANTAFDKNTIVKCLLQIVQQVDNEIHHIEVAMHGVENYTPDQQRLIENSVYKQVIKEDLTRHAQALAQVRQDVRHQDFSDILKMLT